MTSSSSSIFAKIVLIASGTFMLATFFAAVTDPINTMTESMAYFEPQIERRDVVMANRRFLSQGQRSLLESSFQDKRHLRGPDYYKSSHILDVTSTSGSSSSRKEIDVDRISDEVSKKVVQQIVSELNMDALSEQVLQKLGSSIVESSTKQQKTDNNKKKKPVKVFILMGQSNMAGQGDIYGDREGNLEHAILKKNMYRHLIQEDDTANGNFTWATKKDVRYVHIDSESRSFNIKRNGELSVQTAQGPKRKIGPEIEIGWILGDQYPNERILLLKVCTGNRNLGWDLLPPGSKRFEKNGQVYAGYRDLQDTWKNDTPPRLQPPANATDDFFDRHKGWYAGKQYDMDTKNAKKVLALLDKFYPGAEKDDYEISGFFYWQGEKDRRTDAYADRYEQNLVQLIRSLRSDFDAPSAPVVVSSVGFDGHRMEGNTLKVFEAQMSVDGHRRKYPDFQGNVKSVDIRNIWQDKMRAIKQAEHYGFFAEAYMEVGSAMGWGMAQLVKQL